MWYQVSPAQQYLINSCQHTEASQTFNSCQNTEASQTLTLHNSCHHTEASQTLTLHGYHKVLLRCIRQHIMDTDHNLDTDHKLDTDHNLDTEEDRCWIRSRTYLEEERPYHHQAPGKSFHPEELNLISSNKTQLNFISSNKNSSE